MHNAAILAQVAMSRGLPPQAEDDAASVFRVLHGFYGNLFFSKFATGAINDAGEDEGTLSARNVWAHALGRYDTSTIKAALRRCRDAHPEFPPNLPQFAALCAAAQPRGVIADATKLLGMAPALRSVYAAQARAINAKHDGKAAARRAGLPERADPPPGLDALKQAIADASASAGGSEAAELLRLDRILAPQGVAA